MLKVPVAVKLVVIVKILHAEVGSAILVNEVEHGESQDRVHQAYFKKCFQLYFELRLRFGEEL